MTALGGQRFGPEYAITRPGVLGGCTGTGDQEVTSDAEASKHLVELYGAHPPKVDASNRYEWRPAAPGRRGGLWPRRTRRCAVAVGCPERGR